jgi:hypothetical protein
MKHDTPRLSHWPRMIMTLAVLALVGAFLAFPGSRMALAQQANVVAPSGQKVTGSGVFVNDGDYGSIWERYSISGTLCTFDFNAQTVDSAGNTKGQLDFEDKTAGIKIHASLTFTNGYHGFTLYGPATYTIGGVSMGAGWSVMLVPYDGKPGYFILEIDSFVSGSRIWSGPLTKGNITFH